jgi:hypothetical protein
VLLPNQLESHQILQQFHAQNDPFLEQVQELHKSVQMDTFY